MVAEPHRPQGLMEHLPVCWAGIPWLYSAPVKSREEGMKGVLCLVALVLAVLALSFASPASAATNDVRMANAQMRHHHHWQPKKHHYGKGMRARSRASCKMSGSC
jgi:hypothetical protein